MSATDGTPGLPEESPRQTMVAQAQSPDSMRNLEANCPECGTKLIEEEREFTKTTEPIKLSVAVCPACGFYDWLLHPSLANLDDPTKSPAFETGEEWAKAESRAILREHDVPDMAGITISISEAAQKRGFYLGPEEQRAIAHLCRTLGYHKANIRVCNATNYHQMAGGTRVDLE